MSAEPTRVRPTAPRQGAAVAVLGEVLVDVLPDGRSMPGGAPFNVARWMAAFGVHTLFISRLAPHDSAGQRLLAEMQRCGLAQAGLQHDTRHPTGLVHVLPDAQQGHRFEIAADSAWDHLEAAPALPLLRDLAPGVVVFGTLAMRGAAARQALTTMVMATPALRFADLNLRPVEGLRELAAHVLGLADWVKVNDEELQRLLQWFVTGSAPTPGSPAHDAALAALVQRFELQRLIVTCGAQGWYAVDSTGHTDAQGSAEPVAEVHDTVGAGDAFAAATLAACVQGQPLVQALPAAARLAAAVCTWPGALPQDMAVVRHWRQTLGFHPDTTAATGSPA